MWSKTRSSFIEIAWQSDSDTDGIVHRPSRVPNETVAGWSTGNQLNQIVTTRERGDSFWHQMNSLLDLLPNQRINLQTK